MPFHFGFWSNSSGRFGERARKSSHLSLSSMRLSGKHSYSVSIAMVTRGPEQGMLGSLCGALSQECSPNTLDSCGIPIFPLWRVLESCDVSMLFSLQVYFCKKVYFF